ncbi:MAG: hypothetical protein JKY61_05245 [Planctomycetes bacterium]|nr:hypothetical protein [Planctomycetota bacterium]
MAQTTFLVDANSPASNPGGTGVWSNAYQNPQEAFDQAQPGDTVLIAEGSYTPDINGTTNIVAMDTLPGITVTKRHHSFIIPVPMRVVGGFKGYHIAGSGGLDPDAPDGLASNTILHGDSSGTPANIFDNSHHVVHIDGQLSTAFATDLVSLERLVIRDGNTYFSQASSSFDMVRAGAGIFCRDTVLRIIEVTVTSCLADGQGAGIYVTNGAIQTRACIISNNMARNGGGGLMLIAQPEVAPETVRGWERMSQIHNVQFLDNFGGIGGGMCLAGPFYSWDDGEVDHPGLSVANCLILGNRALSGGGAHVLMDPTTSETPGNAAEWVNNTFSKNEAIGTRISGSPDGMGGALLLLQINQPTPSIKGFKLSNSILMFNTGKDANGIAIASNLEAYAGSLDAGSLSHNVIGDQPVQLPNNPDWAGSIINVIDVDPLFANAGVGNYHLSANSPCIEQGDDKLLPYDYRDLDEDGVTTGEFIPLDLDRYLGGNTSQATRDREHPASNPVGASGITGGDGGNSMGPINDLGCYEWKHIAQEI